MHVGGVVVGQAVALVRDAVPLVRDPVALISGCVTARSGGVAVVRRTVALGRGPLAHEQLLLPVVHALVHVMAGPPLIVEVASEDAIRVCTTEGVGAGGWVGLVSGG